MAGVPEGIGTFPDVLVVVLLFVGVGEEVGTAGVGRVDFDFGSSAMFWRSPKLGGGERPKLTATIKTIRPFIDSFPNIAIPCPSFTIGLTATCIRPVGSFPPFGRGGATFRVPFRGTALADWLSSGSQEIVVL